jgi:hypothetical protein
MVRRLTWPVTVRKPASSTNSTAMATRRLAAGSLLVAWRG